MNEENSVFLHHFLLINIESVAKFDKIAMNSTFLYTFIQFQAKNTIFFFIVEKTHLKNDLKKKIYSINI